MNSPASLRHMLNLKFNFIARLYLNYCAVIFYCTFQSFVMVAATPASTSLERRTGICASCHRSRLCIPIQRPQKKAVLKAHNIYIVLNSAQFSRVSFQMEIVYFRFGFDTPSRVDVMRMDHIRRKLIKKSY